MAIGSFLFGGNPQRRDNVQRNQASLEESQFSNAEIGTADDAFANRRTKTILLWYESTEGQFIRTSDSNTW